MIARQHMGRYAALAKRALAFIRLRGKNHPARCLNGHQLLHQHGHKITRQAEPPHQRRTAQINANRCAAASTLGQSSSQLSVESGAIHSLNHKYKPV